MAKIKTNQNLTGLSNTCPQKQGTPELSPQLKTPLGSNPGFPQLVVWQQAYLVRSCFTLLGKINNCTMHPVQGVAGKMVLSTFDFCLKLPQVQQLLWQEWSSACHLQSLTWEKQRRHHFYGHPNGMISPHFTSFLKGKTGRSNAILHRSQKQGLQQGNEELGVKEPPLRNHLWGC